MVIQSTEYSSATAKKTQPKAKGAKSEVVGMSSPGTTTASAKTGDSIPNVTFKCRSRIESTDQNPFDWKDFTTDELFKGKRVVLFSLPGAFTPTCSSTHLPGYEKNYEKIKSMSVDEVYCLSVNDAFVMRQWGLAQGLVEDKTVGSLGFEKVKLLPDGACAFTRGMGMSCTWVSKRKRSLLQLHNRH